MRKRYYKFCKFKYINGIRGAISLFLAVLMTPFLSIAMLLVETGRYNSSVSIVDEAMGISATSTLANYDKYLHDRWGLLALSQEKDVDTLYKQYLAINSSIMGNSIEIESSTASGMYPLTNGAILENQVMEFCEMNAPLFLASNVLNLSDLIGKLEEIKNMDSIFKIINKGTDAVDSMIKLEDVSGELKEIAKNLEDVKTQYSEKYNAFAEAVTTLIEAKKEVRPNEEEDPEGALEYDGNINNLILNVSSTQSNYLTVLNTIITNLENYKAKMVGCKEAMSSIVSNMAEAAVEVAEFEYKSKEIDEDLEGINTTIKEMEDGNVSPDNETYKHALDYRAALESQKKDIELELGISKAVNSGFSKASESWKESFSSYSDENIGQIISGFKSLKEKVNEFDVSTITADSSGLSAEEYYNQAISGYISAEAIDAFLLEQSEELTKGSLSALIKGLLSFLDSIMSLDMFFVPELSGNLNMNYYNQTLGGLPGSLISNSMGDSDIGINGIIRKIAELQAELENFKITYHSLKAVFSKIKDVFEAILSFVLKILERLYERMLFSTYATFNVSCRTDYQSFKSMTGYSVNKILPEVPVATQLGAFGTLSAVIDEIVVLANKTGTDYTFYGAELEYILFGSTSEIANQLYTFLAIYFIRLLFDIGSVCSNAEAQALAAGSTLGYPLIIALLIFLEPLADTIMLVNGGKVELVKSFVYLTPSGLPRFIQGLASIIVLTTEQKESLKDGLVKAFGETTDDYDYQKTLVDYQNTPSEPTSTIDTQKPTAIQEAVSDYKKGLLKLNYRDYCYFLLAIGVSRAEQFARIGNLIQTEGTYYYQKQGVDYTFDLRKSYTYLYTKADVKVNQMLPTLINSSLFKTTREQYRGY